MRETTVDPVFKGKSRPEVTAMKTERLKSKSRGEQFRRRLRAPPIALGVRRKRIDMVENC